MPGVIANTRHIMRIRARERITRALLWWLLPRWYMRACLQCIKLLTLLGFPLGSGYLFFGADAPAWRGYRWLIRGRS